MSSRAAYRGVHRYWEDFADRHGLVACPAVPVPVQVAWAVLALLDGGASVSVARNVAAAVRFTHVEAELDPLVAADAYAVIRCCHTRRAVWRSLRGSDRSASSHASRACT